MSVSLSWELIGVVWRPGKRRGRGYQKATLPAAPDDALGFRGRVVDMLTRPRDCCCWCCCFSHVTRSYNAVRGRRTGSNSLGAEDYPRRRTNKKKEKILHTITENKSYTSDKKVTSAYVSRYISHTLNESQQKPRPRRQHSTHKKKTG